MILSQEAGFDPYRYLTSLNLIIEPHYLTLSAMPDLKRCFPAKRPAIVIESVDMSNLMGEEVSWKRLVSFK